MNTINNWPGFDYQVKKRGSLPSWTQAQAQRQQWWIDCESLALLQVNSCLTASICHAREYCLEDKKFQAVIYHYSIPTHSFHISPLYHFE